VRNPIRFASCHSEKKHFCKGLCKACYQRAYRHRANSDAEETQKEEAGMRIM
jgi:hypothetical protein